MAIYLIYFSLIIIIPFFCSAINKDRKKAQNIALKILMGLMYLLLALKAETVGSDISGYKEWYETTKDVPFSDFSYCYMEDGYLLLMKIFNVLDFSFQGFAAVLYAIIIIPLYALIKRYSPDVMISVMILFCLDFFVFACSGLRQAVAMSLCVWAFLVLTSNNGKKNFLLSIVIVVAASFVHKSAILFLPALMISYFRYKAVTYFVYIMAIAVFLLNKNLLININEQYELSHYEFDDRLTLGLMFVFDVIMFLFFLLSGAINRSRGFENNGNKVLTWQIGNVLFYGLILMVGFNGAILLRSSTYELLFLSILMPMALNYWPNSARQFISFVYVAVLFYCFYFLILKPSTLLIVPYKFFFQ